MFFEGLDLPRLLILVAGLMVYFVPWYIAALRDHHRRFMIGLLNLLLGWSLIGWLIAFLWAVSPTRARREQEEAEQAHAVGRQVQVDSAARPARRYSQAS